MQKVFDALFWLIELHDVRSANPIIAAQKRASLGMFYSLVAAALLCALSVGVAPHTVSTNSDLSAITALLQEYAAVGCALLACLVSLVGIGFIVRYVLMVKWPERFVDLSE